jgi:uncharacterized membrane protein YoaK (UPF0700 family)
MGSAVVSKSSAISALLSFNGGFVDTAGFIGLQGLFTAHVTGNFVTLAATLLSGTHGVVAKLLALPEFVIVIAAARLLDAALQARGLPARRVLLVAKVVCLLAFFVLAVAFGPFPDSDAPAALWTAFAGIAGMAIQNAVQRAHFSNLPPTTLMTGNTTQAVMDGVDLLRGTPGADTGGCGLDSIAYSGVSAVSRSVAAWRPDFIIWPASGVSRCRSQWALQRRSRARMGDLADAVSSLKPCKTRLCVAPHFIAFAGPIITTRHSVLSSRSFSWRQAFIRSASGMNSLQCLMTSGVHARRASAVPWSAAHATPPSTEIESPTCRIAA